jgi:uncharacterized protein (DUF433 family)
MPIKIDYKIQGGSPCIDGTRITTETIIGLYRGGEQISSIADMYNISVAEVEDAIEFESYLSERESKGATAVGYFFIAVIVICVAAIMLAQYVETGTIKW